MEIEVGSILEGKITGITKFGAFVQLPGDVPDWCILVKLLTSMSGTSINF